MAITHSSSARNLKEFRRLRAWELKQKGWSQVKIAEALDVTQGAVSQWCKAAREGGTKALLMRKATGTSSKLTFEQKSKIPELLKFGPAHYGFDGDRWTYKKVGHVVKIHLGVSYHHSHISRILHDLGWTPQSPPVGQMLVIKKTL